MNKRKGAGPCKDIVLILGFAAHGEDKQCRCPRPSMLIHGVDDMHGMDAIAESFLQRIGSCEFRIRKKRQQRQYVTAKIKSSTAKLQTLIKIMDNLTVINRQ